MAHTLGSHRQQGRFIALGSMDLRLQAPRTSSVDSLRVVCMPRHTVGYSPCTDLLTPTAVLHKYARWNWVCGRLLESIVCPNIFSSEGRIIGLEGMSAGQDLKSGGRTELILFFIFEILITHMEPISGPVRGL